MADSMRKPGQVVGAILVIALLAAGCGDDAGGGPVGSVITTLAPTAATLTGGPAEPTTTVPPTTGQVFTTTTEPPSTTAALVEREGWVDDLLFRYSVATPNGFSVEYETGRGIYLAKRDDAGALEASLETVNFRGGVDYSSWVQAYGDETVVSDVLLTVPLYDPTDPNRPLPGESVEVREIEVSGGWSANRWIRLFDLGDRVVLATLAGREDALTEQSPAEVLEGIHLWRGPFVPIGLDQCSTRGLEPIAPSADLTVDQADSFGRIMDALVACDWDGLEAALSPVGFTASFGGGEPIEIWQDSEFFGEGILKTLYDILTLPPDIDEDQYAVWPRAFSYEWSDVDESMKEELRTIGQTESDFAFYEDFGGYIGHRTGINVVGDWQFFVAGD